MNANTRAKAYLPLILLAGLATVLVPYGFVLLGLLAMAMVIDLISA